MTLLDYSSGVIPGAAIRAAGHTGCIRYVEAPTHPLLTKHVRPAEYADLIAAQLEVWLVFEVDTTDALGGYVNGVDYAIRAKAGAAWIGYPADRPIFFAADDPNLTAAQIVTGMAYLDGAASVLGPQLVGAYGFAPFIAAAQAGNHASTFWLCGSQPAPASPAHLWQRNDTSTTVAGIACDINEILRPLPNAVPSSASPRARRLGEDTSMLVTTPQPAQGSAKPQWPAQRISFGFDPIGGWGGNAAIKLHWAAPGGWVTSATWWVRGGTGVGQANRPHTPVAIPLAGVQERFVGLGWELYPPAMADELEVVISAPGGCHIFSVYQT